jgi:hypothetical protein
MEIQGARANWRIKLISNIMFLAKHYTGKELQKLKRIYEKADLKVLN